MAPKTAKKVFSIPMLSGSNRSLTTESPSTSSSSSPITDFINNSKKTGNRNRANQSSSTQSRQLVSHNDLSELAGDTGGHTKKKGASSSSDLLLSGKGGKGSNSSLGSLWKSSRPSSNNDLLSSGKSGNGSNSSLGNLWKIGGSKKGSSTNFQFKAKGKGNEGSSTNLEAKEKEMDEIYNMVMKLKTSSHGQKVLSDFMDYKTGKSTRKPSSHKDRPQVPVFYDDPSSMELPPPISEICMNNVQDLSSIGGFKLPGPISEFEGSIFD